MLALGAFSLSSLPAHAQQEVDPDHYDQGAAAPVHSQSHHKAMSSKSGHQGNVKMASKHSHKAHHHHVSA